METKLYISGQRGRDEPGGCGQSHRASCSVELRPGCGDEAGPSSTTAHPCVPGSRGQESAFTEVCRPSQLGHHASVQPPHINSRTSHHPKKPFPHHPSPRPCSHGLLSVRWAACSRHFFWMESCGLLSSVTDSPPRGSAVVQRGSSSLSRPSPYLSAHPAGQRRPPPQAPSEPGWSI